MTTKPGPDTSRLDDLRVARVHLRLGQLTLARAELEELLHREALDTNGLAALAEARWRTGDGDGAAGAAAAHLDAGGSDDVALCIAAEAAALDGRSAEARELMDRLPASDAATLDALFAGIPRRAFWSAGPVDRIEVSGRPDTPSRQSARGAASAGAHPRRVRAQADPHAQLATARSELEEAPERAFLRLGLVLRHDPALAPDVLEILHLRREPAAALVRGDAQRLLGRHLEAEAAFDAAAESLEVP